MFSIGRYLAGWKGDDLNAAKVRAYSLLLEALAVHAVKLNPGATEDFQGELRALNTALESATDTESFLLTIGRTIGAVQNFHKSIDRFFTARAKELHGIIDLLTTSLLQACESSGESAGALRQIERRIEKATLLEDIRSLRAELKDVVALIQQEASAHESRQVQLKTDLSSLAADPVLDLTDLKNDEDHVTGLPSAKAGERAIRELSHWDNHVYAVVFFLDRLDLINDRYGFANGDKVLIMISQLLAQTLQPTDRLFRWRGPSFLALLRRDAPSAAVHQEVRRMDGTKIEEMLDVGDRKVLMSISTAARLIPIPNGTPPAGVPRLIDKFVAEQSARALSPTHR